MCPSLPISIYVGMVLSRSGVGSSCKKLSSTFSSGRRDNLSLFFWRRNVKKNYLFVYVHVDRHAIVFIFNFIFGCGMKERERGRGISEYSKCLFFV